jgi:hypothetical protein
MIETLDQLAIAAEPLIARGRREWHGGAEHDDLACAKAVQPDHNREPPMLPLRA